MKTTAFALLLASNAFAASVLVSGTRVQVDGAQRDVGTLAQPADVRINGNRLPLAEGSPIKWDATHTLVEGTLREATSFRQAKQVYRLREGVVQLVKNASGQSEIWFASLADGNDVSIDGVTLRAQPTDGTFQRGQLASFDVTPTEIKYAGHSISIGKGAWVRLDLISTRAIDTIRQTTTSGETTIDLFGGVQSVSSISFQRTGSKRTQLKSVTLASPLSFDIGGRPASFAVANFDAHGSLSNVIVHDSSTVVIDGVETELAAGMKLFVSADLSSASLTAEGLKHTTNGNTTMPVRTNVLTPTPVPPSPSVASARMAPRGTDVLTAIEAPSEDPVATRSHHELTR